LLFLSLFLLVKSPFFAAETMGCSARAWAMPPLGCRCSGSARPQALNTSTGGGAGSAAKQPVGPCAKKKGTVQMREILWEIETVLDSYIYIYANKV
jgi:hypothetical protein